MKPRPIALTNWKMAKTVAEGLVYVRELQGQAGGRLAEVETVICPPYTALWPLAQELVGSPIELGAQNIAAGEDPARTGQIAAEQVAEAGAQWVMLGHWEVRRYFGDSDAVVNAKLKLALAAGLRPILMLGPGGRKDRDLGARLRVILDECQPSDLKGVVLVYEPEQAIGTSRTPGREALAEGVGRLREAVHSRLGVAGDEVRVIYGGGVTQENAAQLMEVPGLDGLGATTAARTAQGFAPLIEVIARARVDR